MLLRRLVLHTLLTACVTSSARPTTEPTRDAAATAAGALDATAPHQPGSDRVGGALDAAVSAARLPEAPRPVSGLPVPPGAANQPRPAGTGTHNLRVLSWAGFQGAASYTFDDGQPSHLEHWPELKATKVPVTFYITTGYRSAEPGFDATWRDVVASGSELGNHTVDHCYYSGTSCGVNGTSILSPKSCELDDASDYIVNTTGQSEVWTAATPHYPRGRFLRVRIDGGTLIQDQRALPWDSHGYYEVALDAGELRWTP